MKARLPFHLHHCNETHFKAMTDPKRKKREPRKKTLPPRSKIYGGVKVDLNPEQHKQVKRTLKNAKRKLDRRMKKAFEADGMHERSKILHASLHIERTVKELFIDLANIKDGSFLTNLPFAQKIGLLGSVGALQKKDRDCLDAFRKVRNKFIHSVSSNTYTACFTNLKKERAMVIALVEADAKDREYTVEGTDESALAWGTNLLIHEVTKICDRIREQAFQHEKDKVEGIIARRFITTLGIKVKASDGPFGRKATEILKEGRTHTARDVVQILQATHGALAKMFEQIIKDETANYFKTLEASQKAASPPSGQRRKK